MEKALDTADNNFDFSEEEVEKWFDEEGDYSAEPADGPQMSVEEKYVDSQIRVIRETKDYTLGYLYHSITDDNFIINVSPEYQRRQRWSRKKRSQLIESILMNIPIPPIFLYERDYNKYEVIDGRQRLDTIRDFLSNEFALSGLQFWSELNGKRFDKLPSVIKRGIQRRSISAVVLLAETRYKGDDGVDIRAVLFDRLNTGGEKLNPQELRNALYPGNYNRLIIRLARTSPFTEAWGIPAYTDEEESDQPPKRLIRNTLYKKMADCELVLRYFALREMILENRKGSLRRLLDNNMQRHQNDSSDHLVKEANRFQTNITTLYDIFDGKPFRLPGSQRPLKNMYDSFMVALDTGHGKLRPKNEIKRLVEKYSDEVETKDIIVGRGSTVESIRARVKLAEKILFQ